MRINACAALAAAILLFSSAWAEVGKPETAPGTKLLRFPNVLNDRIVFSYAGDLWTVGTQGGTATRLTSHPGLELFAKFSPDGRYIAFTGQYGGDEQVYILDGGKVFVPEFGTADENGRWIIEGHRVDPDVVVEQDPVAVLNGHDPQLERGIQELLKLLPATPGGLPRRPVSPIKSEVH